MCTLLCTIRQSTNNRARRKAQNAKEAPTTERSCDRSTLTVDTRDIAISRSGGLAARHRSGPYQRRSYIVGQVTEGVAHDRSEGRPRQRRGHRRALGGTVGVAARNLASGAEIAHRRRRALPHGELLQDPRHGRGHAPGRRRRPAARRPAHADRGGQEPRQHAHPLPRGPAPERARPPLPDDHPERQHRHRHALAARRPRLRQRDHAAARPGDHRLLHAEPRVLPHRVGRRRRVGRASAAARSSPAGGSSRRAGSTRTRSAASSRRTRASAAPASCTCTSAAGAATSRSATTTRSPSTRRSTTRARRATWRSCSR